MPYNLSVDKNLFYELKEIHVLTGIPLQSLEYWCRNEKLKSTKPGRGFIVKGEWLIDFFEGKWFSTKSKSKSIIKDSEKIRTHKQNLAISISHIKRKGMKVSDLK